MKVGTRLGLGFAVDIQGAVITIDAMGCQHNIATQIVQSTERRVTTSAACRPKQRCLGIQCVRTGALKTTCTGLLDVAFGEDDCRIRCGDTRTRLGIANRRLKAGWDVAYLSQLLGL